HTSILSIIHSHLIPRIIQISNEIRGLGHPDLFDCLISATAIENNAAFLTEDKSLIAILKGNEEKLGIRTIRWRDIKESIVHEI
ncbi:MAG: hypothetical protein ACW98K_11410, partial [Candidatus Kariarchaeaceae archaeon]